MILGGGAPGRARVVHEDVDVAEPRDRVLRDSNDLARLAQVGGDPDRLDVLLVQVRRYEDGVRRIESIAEMTGMESNTPLLQEIFTYRRRGRQGRHLVGEFTATGIVPHFIEDLRQRGVEVALDWFKKRAGDV